MSDLGEHASAGQMPSGMVNPLIGSGIAVGDFKNPRLRAQQGAAGLTGRGNCRVLEILTKVLVASCSSRSKMYELDC